MALSTTFSIEDLPNDRYSQILKVCPPATPTDTAEQRLARLTSLKLDLRVIQEVEAMEGYAVDADFDDLLYLPKVQDFLAQTQHNEPETRSFWLLARTRYLGTLPRAQRAQVIQTNHQVPFKTASLLAELYKLPQAQERLRFLSRLSYLNFTELLADVDRRALTLRADGGVFLSSIAYDRQSKEVRSSFRRTFFAR